MNGWTRTTLIACTGLLIAAPAAAQASRAERIDRARSEFDDSTAARLLYEALDPALGAPDSLWAVAGYDLALILTRMDRAPLADTWLRWIARHGAEWPIDRAWYPPAMSDAYDRAAAAVRSSPDSGAVATRWQWTGQFDPSARGSLQLGGGAAGRPLRVSIDGGTSVASSGASSLSAGTHELVVSADGFEPVHVSREMLPGVTTVLTPALVPLLPSTVETAVAGRLVRITFRQGGQAVCRNGYVASSDGLVLTSFGAIRGGSAYEVSVGDGPAHTNVSVLATDSARDVAVLKFDTTDATPLATTASVADGQYAWSVARAGCGEVAATRTRLAGWTSPPTGAAGVSSALPGTALGAPLIDRTGLVLGLVTGPERVLPTPLTRGVIDEARRRLVVAVQARPGRGFPWKWVSIGAVAAGAGIVLASRGGGGDAGTGPPLPTTGGIIITFPR